MSSHLPLDGTYLTQEGRRLLEERIQLVSATVAELQRALDDPECRADSVEGYKRATQEVERLRALLDRAIGIEDVPDDPGLVELGDTVAIRLDDGTLEAYIIVDASEAPVEDQRISVQSPLGQALLGKQVGAKIEVQIPAGSYRCTILSASRVHP
jgi:transcription elongation factor GreA